MQLQNFILEHTTSEITIYQLYVVINTAKYNKRSQYNTTPLVIKISVTS